jgi:membrane-associated HD superfamily phosphohydrolase
MKGRLVLFALAFGFLAGSLFGQETLLERANVFYNENDYINAKELYLQVLSSGKFTGETLYRYTYSTEMLNGINSEVLDLYYATWWYLSMDGSNEQYLENSKNKFETNSHDLNLTWGEAQKIVKDYIKVNKQKYSVLKTITNSLRSTGTVGVILFLIFVIIVYILAYTFSKKTKCIIIWSWWDLIFIAISAIIFIYYLFDSENKIKDDVFVNIVYFTATIITLVFSIISNLRYSGIKWPLYAGISILTKIVLLVIIPLIIVLAIICWCLANSGKKDRRFKDGTRNNERTKNYNFYVPIFTAIYTFLIINLIKFDKKLKEE